jgi:uncharacterized protein GlcG (DUF336 family)
MFMQPSPPSAATPSAATPPAWPVLEYGPPIALAAAKRVMAAAEAEAQRNGWPMVIAIVDAAGRLVMLHRLDQAQNGSVAIARQKAETAANFRRPTRLLEAAIEGGGLGLRILGVADMMPLEGGLPLVADGKVVGAIGVSGMQSQQDGVVAKAGAAALAGSS